MEFDDLMKAVLGHPANKVVEWLKANGKAIYQPIFNDGHGVATGNLQPKLDTAEAAKTKAEEQKAAADKALEDYKASNPSTAQLHADYGAKLKEKDDEIARMKTEQAEGSRKSKIEDAVSKLKVKLNAVVIDESLAEAKADNPTVRGRIQVDDTGNLRILQANSTVPFAGDVDAQIQALADEIKGSLKPVLLRSGVDAGTGKDTATGGTGTGNGDSKKGKEFYEAIRKKAQGIKPDAKTDANTPDPRTALETRMGMRPTSAM